MVDRVHINKLLTGDALFQTRKHGTLGDDARFGSHARGCHQTKFQGNHRKVLRSGDVRVEVAGKANLESERAVQAVQPLS